MNWKNIRGKKIIKVILCCTIIFFSGCQKKPAPKPLEYPPVPAQLEQEPEITIYRNETGKTDKMLLEQYVKGVVAGEIGDKFPIEALKAQAIVARTMTMAKMEYENGTRDKYNTDVSDSHKEFQAYDEKAITDKISQAVEATRGQVLMYQGKYIYALFHSLSKDKTASIEEGLPKLSGIAQGYIVPVETNGFLYAPDKYKNWTVKAPRSQIITIMGKEAGDLHDITIASQGASGRASVIKAGKASIPALELREKLGPDTLFSTNIKSINLQGNYVVFQGDGWGHGCGMEQYGAFVMSDQGKTAQEIVQYYYPNTTLNQLYQ